MVDNLSGGRVGLSFASGWHANDFAILPENLPSHRVAERLGARPAGTRDRIRDADGRAYAMDIYALER